MEIMLELLKSKATSHDMMKRYIDFLPYKSEVILRKGDTGVDKNQIFHTECDFGWRVFLYSSTEMYLIADGVSSDKIWLQGTTGYKNIEHTLKKYNEALYSNDKLHITGVPMTLEMFRCLPDDFKNISEPYLLASNNTINNINGIWYADEDIPRFTALYSRKGRNDHPFECAIRPMVKLSLDTLVDIQNPDRCGKTPQKAMKILVA